MQAKLVPDADGVFSVKTSGGMFRVCPCGVAMLQRQDLYSLYGNLCRGCDTVFDVS